MKPENLLDADMQSEYSVEMIYNIDFMIRFFRYGRVLLIES